jgi:hypothetical protein
MHTWTMHGFTKANGNGHWAGHRRYVPYVPAGCKIRLAACENTHNCKDVYLMYNGTVFFWRERGTNWHAFT